MYEVRTAETEPGASKIIQTCIGIFELNSYEFDPRIQSVRCYRIENVNLADYSNNKMIRDLMGNVKENYNQVCVITNMTQQNKKNIWYKVFGERTQEDPSILYRKTEMAINLIDRKMWPKQFYVTYKSSILRNPDHLENFKCFANVAISDWDMKINYNNYCAKKKNIIL